MTPSNQTLVDLAYRPGSDRRTLVCVPHAGAGVALYSHWGPLFEATTNLVAALLPGREERCLEDPLRTMDEITDVLRRELAERDYPNAVLYGHCTGGLVAYALAHRLLREDGYRPLALAVSSTPVPDSVSDMHTLSPADLKAYLVGFSGGDPDDVSDELWELLEPAIRADLLAAETASYPLSPVDIPILAVRGANDEVIEGANTGRWAAYTRATCTVTELPASHFLVDTGADALGRTLLAFATAPSLAGRA